MKICIMCEQRGWWRYLLPKRLTLVHNPRMFRWLFWGITFRDYELFSACKRAREFILSIEPDKLKVVERWIKYEDVLAQLEDALTQEGDKE